MVNFSLKPLGDNVLVKPEKKKEHSQGGLIIPAIVNQDLEEGTVVAISPDVLYVVPGDKIMYPARIGTSILIDQETYKFIAGPILNSPGSIIAITNPVSKENI